MGVQVQRSVFGFAAELCGVMRCHYVVGGVVFVVFAGRVTMMRIVFLCTHIYRLNRAGGGGLCFGEIKSNINH